MTFIAKAMERAGSGPPPAYPKPPNPAQPPAEAATSDDDTLTFVGRAMDTSGESDSPTAAVLRPVAPVTQAASQPAVVPFEPRIAPRQVSQPMGIEGSYSSGTKQGVPLGWVVLGFGLLAIGVGFFALPGGSEQAPRPVAASGDSPAASIPAQNVAVALTSHTAFSAPATPLAAKALPLPRPVSSVKATMPVIERRSFAPARETGPVLPSIAKSVALGAAPADPVKKAVSGKVPPPIQAPSSVQVPPSVKVSPPVERVAEAAPIEISEPADPARNAMAMLEFYNLEGIFFTKTDPAAIINDRIVDPGDTIGDLTVIEIRRNSVIVEIAGQRLELR